MKIVFYRMTRFQMSNLPYESTKNNGNIGVARKVTTLVMAKNLLRADFLYVIR